MTWQDELMATCGAEPLATGNISRRLAAVHEVLRSVALLRTPSSCTKVDGLMTLAPILKSAEVQKLLHRIKR